MKKHVTRITVLLILVQVLLLSSISAADSDTLTIPGHQTTPHGLAANYFSSVYDNELGRPLFIHYTYAQSNSTTYGVSASLLKNNTVVTFVNAVNTAKVSPSYMTYDQSNMSSRWADILAQ